MCAFIPKYHWFPFLVWRISGSRSPLRFFVDDGAVMMLASTIVPVFNRCPSAPKCALISSNSLSPRPCFSNRWRKFTIVVSSGSATRQSQPREAAHRLHLVEQILHAGVAEVVEQLHAMHA